MIGIDWSWHFRWSRRRKYYAHVSTDLISPAGRGGVSKFGVPQGSVLGLVFFTLYIAPKAKIFSSHHGISHQQFAADIQSFISFSPDEVANNLTNLGDCLQDLFAWFTSNGLCFNATKSECLLVGTAQRLKTMPDIASINVAGSTVPFSSSIRTLGAHLDTGLTFDYHVQSLCKSCFYHIKALRHIRGSIDLNTAKAIACSLVSSRLDYANSILYGMSAKNINKPRVQNALARIVVGPTLSAVSCSQLLCSLHWLPVHLCIQFKIACLTHKILRTRQPSYLSCLMHH